MRDKDYWKKRGEDNVLQSEKSVVEFETDLMTAYDIALASVRKEIDAFFGKYARQNKIPYADVRKKLLQGEFTEFNTLLREWYQLANELGMDSNYIAYLEQLGKRVYLTRLESLEANIRFHIEKLKAVQNNGMTALLMVNYAASYYNTYFNLAQGIEVAVRFDAIDDVGVRNAVKTKWEGKNYSDRIWSDKTALIASLKTIIPQSFSRGFNSNKLGDMIANATGVSKKRARALARTEVNNIANQGAIDMYKAAGVIKYEYLATLDMRTSDICRDLDGYIGTVALAVVNVNYPPMHVNCRSTTVPYFEKDIVTTRVAKDENGKNILVPRRMTQEEWIKKYVPEDQQEKMLQFRGKYRPVE